MTERQKKPARPVAVCDLGRLDYHSAWDLQRSLQSSLIRAKRAEPARCDPHVVLMLEHPPVYTLGKSGSVRNLLLSDERLESLGADLVHIDRGGDITFHGPGQLVVYPILDLDDFYTDIHRYLRDLEETVIRVCDDFEVVAGRVPSRTGVWVGPDGRGPERKICAMGIKCSRWVTSHGLALNVSTDLSYFDHIVPCGITDRSVTSLVRETGRDIDIRQVKSRFVDHLGRIFDVAIRKYSGDAATSYLSACAA